MAIAKVIFNNGITSTVWMDVTQDTVVSSNLLSGESATRADGVSILGTYVPPSFSTMSSTFTPTETTTTITPATGYDGFSQVKINGISSTYVGTGITRRSAADLTSNGAYITAPIGYYSSAVSKAVATATQVTPGITVNANGLVTATATQTAGYVAAGTKTSTSQLTSVAGTTITPTEASQLAVASARWTTGSVYVGAISSNYVGSNIPTKSSANLTVSGSTVTAPAGYYSAQATANVASAEQAVPAISINASGKITATATQTAGYVAAGTATSTYQMNTAAGGTVVPSETARVATAKNTYTLASVLVAAISSTYVGSGVPTKSSADLTASDGTVTAPIGYYSASATYAFPNATVADPTLILNTTSATVRGWADYTSGYLSSGGTSTTVLQLSSRAGATITPTEVSQLAVSSGYFTIGSVYVGPIPSAYIIPTGTLSITSNNIYDITSYASVDVNVAGLVPTGTYEITSNGIYDVTNYASASVSVVGNYQAKTVIPSMSQQIVEPDSPFVAVNIESRNTTTTSTYGYLTPISFAGASLSDISYIRTNGEFAVKTASYGSVVVTFENTIISNFAGSDYLFHDFMLDGNVIPHEGMTISYPASMPLLDIYYKYSANSSYYFGIGFSSTKLSSYTFSNFMIEFDNEDAFPVYDALSQVTVEPIPDEYMVFRSMAYNQTLKSSNPGVLSWIGGLTTISGLQFMGRNFDGNFIFSNVSTMGQSAFAQSPTYISYHYFDFPLLTVIPSYAFNSRHGLSIISASICSNISTSAFYYCQHLVEAYFPSVQYISSYAFYYCTQLASINASSCKRLYASAFNGCSALTILDSASFPNVSYVSSYVFANCAGLSEVILSSCTNFEHYVFASCSGLISVDLPELTNVNAGTFVSCYNLTNISLPKLSNAGTSTFGLCSALSSIYLPKLSEIGSYTFDRCINLSTIILEATTSVYTSAFRSCYNLLSLYILASSVATLGNANAFNSTPISTYTTSTGGVYGSIYVPSSLYAAYSTATNWKTYAARFVSMTDAQISAFLSSLT